MKKTLILFLALCLNITTPSSAFYSVEHTEITKVKIDKKAVKKSAKKNKIKFKTKKVLKNKQQNEDRKSWASVVLIGISFMFFWGAVILFLFAPLAISYIALLGVTTLCFLIFLVIAFVLNSWGQKRKIKKEKK